MASRSLLWAKRRHSGIGLPAQRAKHSIIQSRRSFRSLFHLYTAAGLSIWNSYAFICTSAAASARSLRALKSAVRSWKSQSKQIMCEAIRANHHFLPWPVFFYSCYPGSWWSLLQRLRFFTSLIGF